MQLHDCSNAVFPTVVALKGDYPGGFPSIVLINKKYDHMIHVISVSNFVRRLVSRTLGKLSYFLAQKTAK